MSKTIDSTELIRLAWITALRTQGDRKCTGSYFKGHKVCALGLLGEVAGEQTVDVPMLPKGGGGFYTGKTFLSLDDTHDIGALAGLDEIQSDRVVSMNDGVSLDDPTVSGKQHTFSEIADVVEAWFADDKKR